LAPLFSLTSTRSWGVGEFLDLPAFAAWAASAGQDFVQILPITEIPETETSPYSALTAMAIDPIYIALPAVEDFRDLGGEAALSIDEQALLADVRASPRVRHATVRRLKGRWLRRCHDRHRTVEATGGPRAARFANFTRANAWWLDDYATFQALRTRFAQQPWWEWPDPLKTRDARAIDAARLEHADEIRYRQYVQWIASEQWAEVRRAMAPTRVFGDLPFMISGDSPDVWTRQDQFRFDATVGAPPDAFSETGQDWGLPPWRWDVMSAAGFEWMHQRARRNAQLFDGLRLDHLVGLYRTFIRPTDPAIKPFFAPADPPTQTALGERIVRAYLGSSAEIVAEDLGTVPDFVRASLKRLGVPGCKVLRWERQWNLEGQPYLDPATYPEASVATTGTHDTEPLVCWWEDLPAGEREVVLRMPAVRRHLPASFKATQGAAMPPELVDAMLQALLDARSRLAIIPIQDVFGWPDRINTPAHVSDDNWTWRVPWPVDRWADIDTPRRRAEQLRTWTQEAGRSSS
jgi:4-alpha-glucanotransferase